MLPRDLKVASLNVRDMAKRLTVQANAAFTLPLSYMQYYVLCTTRQLSGGERGSTSISMEALGLQTGK